MRRAYYQNKVSEFLMDSADVIMGRLAQINEFDLDLNQPFEVISKQLNQITEEQFGINKKLSGIK